MNPADDIFIECLAQIKQDEGYRGKVYVCPAGALTIGYGRNVDDSGPGITEAEAAVLLANDITDCDIDCRTIFLRWSGFSARRRATLINLRFQLGPGGLRAFKRMIAAINNDDWQLAARELMDSALAKQTPHRTARRAREMEVG